MTRFNNLRDFFDGRKNEIILPEREFLQFLVKAEMPNPGPIHVIDGSRFVPNFFGFFGHRRDGDAFDGVTHQRRHDAGHAHRRRQGFDHDGVVDAVLSESHDAAVFGFDGGAGEPNDGADDEAAAAAGHDPDAAQKRQIKRQNHGNDESRRDDGPNGPKHATDERRRRLKDDADQRHRQRRRHHDTEAQETQTSPETIRRRRVEARSGGGEAEEAIDGAEGSVATSQSRHGDLRSDRDDGWNTQAYTSIKNAWFFQILTQSLPTNRQKDGPMAMDHGPQALIESATETRNLI